jgi:hypothetical protein
LFVESLLESLILDARVEGPLVDTDGDRVLEVTLSGGTNLLKNIGRVVLRREVTAENRKDSVEVKSMESEFRKRLTDTGDRP